MAQMRLAQLFVTGLLKAPQYGRIGGAGAGPSPAQGAFITPQSLASFGGASFAVSVGAKVMEAVFNVTGPPVTFTIALCVGALIYLLTIREPAARPTYVLDWVISIGVAVLNSFVLAAASLGMLQIAGGDSSGMRPPGAS